MLPMTLDQLLVLKEIVEQGSFRAAGQKLNRAQSAISYAIRQLEDHLGQALFDRNQYRPELTEAGRTLYRKVTEVLREHQELEALAALLRTGVEAQIEIGIAALIPLKWLRPVLCAFAKKFPRTRLSLRADVLGADRQLLSGETELALAEPPTIHNALEVVPFGEVLMRPVIANSHPQIEQIKSISSSALREVPQIVVRSSSGAEDRSAGVMVESKAWRVSDFSSKLELIEAGLGWGRMPVHLIEEGIKKKKLKVLKDDLVYRVPLSIARRRGGIHGPAGQFLWEQLQTIHRYKS